MQGLQYKFLSEHDIQISILQLFYRIEDSKQSFDYVVGIENGGLNVSIPLAEKLGLPHKSIYISFYGDSKLAGMEPKKVDTHGLSINPSDKVLIVDDLIDKGATIQYFKNTFPCQSKIGVLFWNKLNTYNIVPDYYVHEKPQNMWLKFYWEK